MSHIESADPGRAMDRIYRKQRHIYDATRKFYLLGRDQLISDLGPGTGDTVLELGCGTGRNLIQAARQYPRARFYGVDVSTEMLDSAMAAVARAGLEQRIHLAQGDAARFDPKRAFGVERFDRIFISYAVSMIAGWQSVIDHAAGTLEAGGTLHVLDFGQQDDLPGIFRSTLFAWLRQFHVTPRHDLRRTMEVVAARRGKSARFRKLYRGYSYYGVLGSRPA